MGSSLALFLARKGAQVTLFDKATKPMDAASRWNEGKIHLGYLYNADSSLRTARHIMPGGLLFRPLVEDLIGCDLGPVMTRKDDIYLCHLDSVVAPEAMAAYLEEVTEMVRGHPDARHYLADASEARVQRLSAAELAEVCNPERFTAGFRVPERSVETTWLADRFVAALEAERQITLQMNTRVTGLAVPHGSSQGPWWVESTAGRFDGYDCVINALWEGRMAIDQSVGLAPQGEWSNRYRQSLFLHSKEAMDCPCVIIATGPFGDIKNYNGRDFYLSWYPAGLRAESSAIAPPERETLDMPDPEVVIEAVFANLQKYLPWVAELRERADSIRVEGGWVFAAGRGALSAPSSTLHRRSEYGVVRKGSYISIDTGKYSTAPWSARAIVDEVM